jgi:pyridoxine/pyridoxamine 5'-phosphate oxidase
MTLKEQILTHLQHLEHGVISTVNANGHPEGAFVGFSQTDDLRIIIGTFITCRKYKNILHHPRVSLVF